MPGVTSPVSLPGHSWVTYCLQTSDAKWQIHGCSLGSVKFTDPRLSVKFTNRPRTAGAPAAQPTPASLVFRPKSSGCRSEACCSSGPPRSPRHIVADGMGCSPPANAMPSNGNGGSGSSSSRQHVASNGWQHTSVVIQGTMHHMRPTASTWTCVQQPAHGHRLSLALSSRVHASARMWVSHQQGTCRHCDHYSRVHTTQAQHSPKHSGMPGGVASGSQLQLVLKGPTHCTRPVVEEPLPAAQP